ncbi:hypothetical protein ACFXP3_32370, partial [Streptomyces sp. NPDC059096]
APAAARPESAGGRAARIPAPPLPSPGNGASDTPTDDEGAADPARWRGLNLLGFALMEARERLRTDPE